MKEHLRATAMCICAAALGLLAFTNFTFAQVPAPNPEPKPNCICGPVNDCNGIPITATANCPNGWACSCVPVFGENNCIAALDAQCHLPS